MTKDHIEAFNILFDEIYQGNQEAKELSFKILELAHTWDDLIDKDKQVTDEAINKAFMIAMFELSQYPLWRTAGLDHHMVNVYLRWRDATRIENDKSSSDDDLIKCYMLRAGFYDIFVIIAFHLFGLEWCDKVGVKVRKFYGEKPMQFLEEIRNG